MNPYADPVAGIYSEAGQAWADGLAAAISIIDQHTPSIENDDADEMDALDASGSLDADDWGNFARRTCACGVKIDGFYEYVDHLKTVLGAAGP